MLVTMTGSTGSTTMRPARTEDAVVVARWPTSVSEAAHWCSRREHPVAPETVTGWWAESDVLPRVLVREDDVPVAYGELWVDAEEDEVELARLIVDPARRRQGLGRRLVDHLLTEARATGLTGCILRVVPDNDAALATYRSVGFVDVDPAAAADWNTGQPTSYVWLEHARIP